MKKYVIIAGLAVVTAVAVTAVGGSFAFARGGFGRSYNAGGYERHTQDMRDTQPMQNMQNTQYGYDDCHYHDIDSQTQMPAQLRDGAPRHGGNAGMRGNGSHSGGRHHY